MTNPDLITLDEAAAEAGWPLPILAQLATSPWALSDEPHRTRQPRPSVVPPTQRDSTGRMVFDRRLWRRVAFHAGRPVVTIPVIAAALDLKEQSVRSRLWQGRMPAPAGRRPLPRGHRRRVVDRTVALVPEGADHRQGQPVWWVDEAAEWLPGFGVREEARMAA